MCSLSYDFSFIFFIIGSVQLIAKGVKNPNVPFHVGAAGHTPVHGIQEPGVSPPKQQLPVKPISMTSALKEVGVVGTCVKRQN